MDFVLHKDQYNVCSDKPGKEGTPCLMNNQLQLGLLKEGSFENEQDVDTNN